jgi:AraC-like DNA-binding protein
MQPSSTVGIRPAWHFGLVRHCQLFLCETSAQPLEACRCAVHQYLQELPAPATALESAFLRLAVQDLLIRWVHGLHSRYHVSPQLQPRAPFCAIAVGHPPTVRSARDFSDWIDTALRTMRKAHPESAAEDARWILMTDTRLALSAVARRLGVPAHRLRRDFRLRFGMPLREFQTRMRVARALPLLGNQQLKIDAAARDAGFRSRRNFYAALAHYTGLGPSAIRALAPEHLNPLAARVTALPALNRPRLSAIVAP